MSRVEWTNRLWFRGTSAKTVFVFYGTISPTHAVNNDSETLLDIIIQIIRIEADYTHVRYKKRLSTAVILNGRVG